LVRQHTSSTRKNHFFDRRRRIWLIVVLVLALAGMGLAGPLARLLSRPAEHAAPTPLERRGQGFGQRDSRVGYAFLVHNPDAEQAVQNAEYRLTAYDAAGAALSSEAGPIVLVLPGETLGIGGSLTIAADTTVARVGLELQGGSRAAVRSSPPLSVDTVRYHEADNDAAASGVVHNPFAGAISDVRVSAVAYDSNGHIIGGGAGYVAFVPAAGALGSITALDAGGSVARVEMYAAFSDKSVVIAPGEGMAPGTRPPALAAQGFGQAGRRLGYGLLLDNPNPDHVVQGCRYHLTAYAADGSVLATDAGRIELLRPSETLGVAGVVMLESDEVVARLEAHILADRVLMSGQIPAFGISDVTYQADGRVTGQVVSPYPQRVTAVRVTAIAYDAAGAIVGGGYTTLDAIAAQARETVDVPVVTSGVPARVALYATRTALTTFE
jgi:hypothetical protein